MPETDHRRARPLELLADPDFRRLWLIGGVTGMVRWLDMIMTAVWVFDVTRSPGAVATVTFLRLLPMMGGAFAGALVERFPLRVVLRIGLGGLAAVYLAMTVLALAGLLTVWHAGIGAAAIGLYWATEMSVRRTMLGEIAGAARVGAAMGLDWSTINTMRLFGPLAGGAAYSAWGIGACYAACFACFGLGCAITFGIRSGASASAPRGGAVLAAIAAGIRTMAGHQVLKATLAVTFALNFFGFAYTSMIPVIAKQELAAPPVLVGLLSSAEGIGALAGSFTIAALATPRLYGPAYVLGSLGLLCGAFVFSLSGTYWLSLLALGLGGLGAALFATMQSSLILTHAPPEGRSRLMGVLTTTIGIGQIGTLHVGLMATYLGAPVAVTVSTLEGIVLVTLAAWRWPRLWRGAG